MLIAVLRNKFTVLFIIILDTLSFPLGTAGCPVTRDYEFGTTQ